MSDEKLAGDVIKSKKRELDKTVTCAVKEFCEGTGTSVTNIDVHIARAISGTILDICAISRVEIYP